MSLDEVLSVISKHFEKPVKSRQNVSESVNPSKSADKSIHKASESADISCMLSYSVANEQPLYISILFAVDQSGEPVQIQYRSDGNQQI